MIPQHFYIENGDYKVDYIIRMENYEEGWNHVINDVLKLNIPMIHANKTKDKKETKLTKSQKKIIDKFYARDFELLGYEKY